MPDSLLFDGVDDLLPLSIGGGNLTGAYTFAAVVKRDNDNSTQAVITNRDSGGNDRLALLIRDADMLRLVPGNSDSAATVTAADGWALIAATKAAGTATPRFHIYKYDAETWVHENGSLTLGNPVTQAGGETRFGQYAGSFKYDGNILIGGVWGSVLSDAEIEALASGLPAWEAAAPLEAWRLDTMSTISTFAPGGTSAETARTGTTLDAGNAPAGWTDVAPFVPPGLFDPELVPEAWF